MFFYSYKRIKSITPSSLSPHYAAQSPSGRKPDLVAKEVLEWWQTNGKHPFIQPHISSPSNVGANSPENLPLGDKVQLIRLPVASPSAVKEFSQVSSEEPAHLTTGYSEVVCALFVQGSLIIRARHFSSRARRFSGALRLLNLRLSPFTGLIKSDLLSGIQQFYLVPNHPK
ncbi:hypothetical protein J3Q64DRAFT_1695613 [Phycomyces blakesleeanus]|uniref:Uncharacterized protein n=1 Tax=Phycomyces blakesleeanus TaxID=4837 RepID=A0ABR3B7D9_PHYBL